jgi:hypothetical protein
MDHHFDAIGLAHEHRLDEAVLSLRRAAECGAGRAPHASPHPEADKPVAAMTADETRDAMYEECSGIRLDLIYCRALPGELRKRWANRLGSLDLGAAATPEAVEKLSDGLAVFASSLDPQADRDLQDIRERLRRLRALCLRHQQLSAKA